MNKNRMKKAIIAGKNDDVAYANSIVEIAQKAQDYLIDKVKTTYTDAVLDDWFEAYFKHTKNDVSDITMNIEIFADAKRCVFTPCLYMDSQQDSIFPPKKVEFIWRQLDSRSQNDDIFIVKVMDAIPSIRAIINVFIKRLTDYGVKVTLTRKLHPTVHYNKDDSYKRINSAANRYYDLLVINPLKKTTRPSGSNKNPKIQPVSAKSRTQPKVYTESEIQGMITGIFEAKEAGDQKKVTALKLKLNSIFGDKEHISKRQMIEYMLGEKLDE